MVYLFLVFCSWWLCGCVVVVTGRQYLIDKWEIYTSTQYNPTRCSKRNYESNLPLSLVRHF